MRLTNRLLLFFLGALAVVLVGFSLTLYLLARNYLYRQANERLEAATTTLVAAADVSPEGVEWEPGDRVLTPGEGPLGGSIVWLITDERGQVVDRSSGTATEGLQAAVAGPTARQPPAERATWDGQPWMVSQRWLRAPGRGGVTLPLPPSAQPRKGEERKHPALAVTVALPVGPVSAALWTLALVLTGLSLIVWLAALATGRWVCRRALAPLTQMAAAARAMNAAELSDRLPSPGTRDEVDHLSQSFNGLLDRVEESFERQRQFTGDASHQLRTPLTAMLGQVEVALRSDRPAEEYRRALVAVHRQSDHLRRIVEALLFLARADAEARLPDLEAVDLAEWLPRHLGTRTGCPRTSDLQTQIGPDGPHRVETQPPLLAELLNNLLDNAVKYSPPGTPITVALGTEPGAVTLSVEDQGCGIVEEELPFLFDPFFRCAEARRRGVAGIGLGLSVAHRLAQAFGARIEVSSRVGSGSRFTVRFPAAGIEPGANGQGTS